MSVSSNLVDRLMQSFDELDRCISLTKNVLVNKPGIPANVIARIKNYDEIVLKQRNLAQDLRVHLERQNWGEVGRHVKLINALSGLIKDDAQAILAGRLSSEALACDEMLVS